MTHPRFRSVHNVRRAMPALCVAVLASAAFHADVMAADKKAPATKAASAPASAKVATQWVKVEDAWVRPTVKGQTATGGFMSLTASQALTLTGFSTPSAGESELHEMVMDGDTMRMHSVEALPLPAGQKVTLRPGPGGQHLMLMDVKKPLTEGQSLTLTLKLKTADGRTLTQDVKVPVKAAAPMMMHGGGMGAGMMRDAR